MVDCCCCLRCIVTKHLECSSLFIHEIGISFIVFHSLSPFIGHPTGFSIYNATNHFPSFRNASCLLSAFAFYSNTFTIFGDVLPFSAHLYACADCKSTHIYSCKQKHRINKQMERSKTQAIFFFSIENGFYCCAVRAWCCRAVWVQVKGKLSFYMWNGIVFILCCCILYHDWRLTLISMVSYRFVDCSYQIANRIVINTEIVGKKGLQTTNEQKMRAF